MPLAPPPRLRRQSYRCGVVIESAAKDVDRGGGQHVVRRGDERAAAGASRGANVGGAGIGVRAAKAPRTGTVLVRPPVPEIGSLIALLALVLVPLSVSVKPPLAKLARAAKPQRSGAVAGKAGVGAKRDAKVGVIEGLGRIIVAHDSRGADRKNPASRAAGKVHAAVPEVNSSPDRCAGRQLRVEAHGRGLERSDVGGAGSGPAGPLHCIETDGVAQMIVAE